MTFGSAAPRPDRRRTKQPLCLPEKKSAETAATSLRLASKTSASRRSLLKECMTSPSRHATPAARHVTSSSSVGGGPTFDNPSPCTGAGTSGIPAASSEREGADCPRVCGRQKSGEPCYGRLKEASQPPTWVHSRRSMLWQQSSTGGMKDSCSKPPAAPSPAASDGMKRVFQQTLHPRGL